MKYPDFQSGFLLKNPMIYLKLTLMAFFWGGAFIAGRIVSLELGAFSAAFLRFVIASMILNIFAARQNQWRFWRVQRDKWFIFIVLGLTGIALYNLFFFKGLQTVEAGRAAAIVAMNPIFVSLFSVLLLKERFKMFHIAGFFLSVSGAFMVISRGNPIRLLEGSAGVGEVFILGCVFTWVIYSLVGKFVLNEISPLRATALASLIGAVLLLFPALSEGLVYSAGQLSVKAWIAMIYLSVFATVIAFVWFYQGVKQIGPAKSSQFINLVPVSAIVLAFLFIHEPVTISLIIGASLVVLGVFITQTTKM